MYEFLITLHSSWKTACWIILLLFKPPAMSSKSIADLARHKFNKISSVVCRRLGSYHLTTACSGFKPIKLQFYLQLLTIHVLIKSFIKSFLCQKYNTAFVTCMVKACTESLIGEIAIFCMYSFSTATSQLDGNILMKKQHSLPDIFSEPFNKLHINICFK